MKDLDDFQKLFKVNFPVEEHHQYYLDTMMKSPFYAGVGLLVKEYEQYEIDIDKSEHSSLKSYKIKKIDEISNFIKTTDVYNKLLNFDFNKEEFRKKDIRKQNYDSYFISIDFKQANYNCLKSIDDVGELEDSWEELCMKFDTHKILVKSKSFRQIVFGNTNPKRLTRLQHKNITIIVNDLINKYGYNESDFMFISHDEFIVKLNQDAKSAVGEIIVLNNYVSSIINKKNINMPTHYDVYTLNNIGKNKFLKTHFNAKVNELSESYKTLFGVPSNMFYQYFKKHVLEEEIEDRDLYFILDKKPAKWVI